MDQVEIASNWISDDDKGLDRLIVCAPEKTGIESVTADTCVCLIQKNTENDCTFSKPELTIKSKHLIKELNIYSEASLIEVFGVYNEYLCTCKAEFFDDWEGLAVYHAIIQIPQINTCTLKFTRIREKDRLWLYNIQATTIKSDSPDIPNHRLFNFQNATNLLNYPQSNLQISEKAEHVKKIVEAQLKISPNNPPFSFQSLLTLINRECNFQIQDCRKNLTKCLHTTGFLYPSGNSSKDDMSKNKLDNDCIINYIDGKFIEMKTELMNQIENHFIELRNESNAKLDEIFKLLEKSNI